MENPLTRDEMIAVNKKDLRLVCQTLILGIKAEAEAWDNSTIGAGAKNSDTCARIHALTGLLCQVHNRLGTHWSGMHTR